MKKIDLYFISKCKETASVEEFNENICSVVSNKKQITEYILNSTITKHKAHYISWLKNHNLANNDKSKSIYVTLLLEDSTQDLESFCVKKQTYNAETIAETFRIYMKCAPVGCSYESEDERNYYLWFSEELMKNAVEKMETEIDKLSKKSVDSNN